MGSSKYSDSPLKCNCKNSTGSFFKLIVYVVNHLCSLFWRTQVFALVRAGGKQFWILRASLRTVNGVIYKVCATNAGPTAQVMLGHSGCILCHSEKHYLPPGRADFIFFFHDTWVPSCIFAKLFFQVQQLNNHHLKSWGMMFLTCEPCRALGGLGLYRGRWVFWLWSGI